MSGPTGQRRQQPPHRVLLEDLVTVPNVPIGPSKPTAPSKPTVPSWAVGLEPKIRDQAVYIVDKFNQKGRRRRRRRRPLEKRHRWHRHRSRDLGGRGRVHVRRRPDSRPRAVSRAGPGHPGRAQADVPSDSGDSGRHRHGRAGDRRSRHPAPYEGPCEHWTRSSASTGCSVPATPPPITSSPWPGTGARVRRPTRRRCTTGPSPIPPSPPAARERESPSTWPTRDCSGTRATNSMSRPPPPCTRTSMRWSPTRAALIRG